MSYSVSLLKDISFGPDDSYSSIFTLLNGKLYFSADDGINGQELWVTGGTAAGTTILKDINSGSSGSFPDRFTVFNNKLYFVVSNSTNGYSNF